MKMMKRCTLSLATLVAFGCKSTSQDLVPDVRHWGLDLSMATPHSEHLEDFLNDLDLQGSVKDLEEKHQERIKALAELQAIDLSQESPGRVYNIKKKIAVALVRESSYYRAMAARRLYNDTNQWRLTDPELLLEVNKDQTLEEESFKFLEL